MGKNGVNYLEGFLLMQQGPLDLSFYPVHDQLRITALVTQSGVVYVMELAKYYDQSTQNYEDKVPSLSHNLRLFSLLCFSISLAWFQT